MSIAFAVLLSIIPCPIRIAIMRSKGAKIGSKVNLGFLSLLLADQIEIGDDTCLAPLCFVKARRVQIGKRVRIGALSYISTGQIVLGDDTIISKFAIVAGHIGRNSEFITGKRCWIFPFCWIDTTRQVHLEDEVGVGGASYIFTHGSWQSILEGFPVAFGPVIIKRNVWLSWRVLILPNVTIGEYSTIAAGAVINKDIPPYSLAGGVPAKIIKADGQHLRIYSVEQKLDLVRQILREAVAQLEYDGYSVETGESDESFWFGVDGYRVVFKRIFESISGISIVISWERMSDELILRAGSSDINWFDLTRRRCSVTDDPIFGVIRSAFSQYGVRFEPTDYREIDIVPDLELAMQRNKQPDRRE